jgi:hypothetical protein
MRQNPSDDELLRSYLLGELPEPQADHLEERLLADDELFDLMEALEAELLAACSRGELAPAERERVLRRLASSPQGRERLALAGSLNTLADGLSRDQTAKPSVLPFRRPVAAPQTAFRWAALAAAGLLMTAGVGWFALRGPQAGSSGPLVAHERPAPANPVPAVPQAQTPPAASAPSAQEPSPAPDRLAGKTETGTAKESPRISRSLIVLSLTTLRGAEEVEKFDVPRDAGVVEMQLSLEGLEDFESFDVTIRSKEKGTIWEQNGLTRRQQDWGPALVLDVPAEQLAGGRYEVRVQGAPAEGESEELAIQEFEIVRAGRI